MTKAISSKEDMQGSAKSAGVSGDEDRPMNAASQGAEPSPLISQEHQSGLILMRRLVNALLVVMILGFLTLIALFILRLQPDLAAKDAIELRLPHSLQLPAGFNTQAFARTADYLTFISTSEIAVYDAQNYRLLMIFDLPHLHPSE